MAADLSQLPVGLFMSTDGPHPSASAQNAADATLRQRVVDRSVLLSEPLRAMVAFAMRLAYDRELSPTDISIQWRPQKIEIDKDMIVIFEFKLKLGIPEEQILTEMGYTDTEIALFQPNIDKKRTIAEDAAEAGMLNAAKAINTAPGGKEPQKSVDKKDEKKDDA